MSKNTRKLAIGFVVILLIIVCGNLIQQFSSRSALERYKAELREKGEKLTFKDLAIGPSTNADEVAALNVLNGYASNYSSLSGSLFPNVMNYVSPGKARAGWRGGFQAIGGNGLSTNAEWKTLEGDNQRAAAALAQIRPALLVSPPDSGWIYHDVYSNAIGGPARNFIRDRYIAQALQRDAIGELYHTNLDEALNDLHALIGQVRMNRNELTLVSQMIRIAIAGLSLNTTWEALQAPGWDDARLAALQKDWERAEIMNGLERALDAERAFAQVIMERIRHAPIAEIKSMFYAVNGNPSGSASGDLLSRVERFWKEDAVWITYRVTGSANRDELTQLRFSTRSLNLMQSLNSGRPWPEVAVELSNMVTELDRKVGADRFHSLKVTSLVLPNVSRAIQTAVRTETQRRLTITAIAIKRYELKHGQPPPTLAALVPEYFAKVPIDPMSGRTFCYRLNASGGFVLYSVGEDGNDDGGNAGTGLWSGLDAVWPTVATTNDDVIVTTSTVPK